MKDHLIYKKQENKFSIISHRIILIVLIMILIYQFTIDYNNIDKIYFLYLHQINLYLNILYFLLCFISDIYKKDTKKSYQIFFHFCFSLSSSLPFFYLIIGIIYFGEEKFYSNISFTLLGMLISPIIFNFLETLIIKRYKPAYINPIFLILFLTIYYCIMYSLAKMGLGNEFYRKYLLDIKFLGIIYFTTLFGAIFGWWMYKIVTRPKVKKIDLNNNIDSSELSEE